MSLEKVDDLDKGKYLGLFAFGFIAWLVPFLVSFLFFDQTGTLIVGQAFFKSVMTVVGSIVAVVLLFSYLQKISVNYLKESILVAVVWFAMSIILDIVILLPMSKMDIVTYSLNIGLGYLAIPIIVLFAGYLLESKSEHNKKIFSQVFSTKK
jgi:hypothetical protein